MSNLQELRDVVRKEAALWDKIIREVGIQLN